jgi:predicted  nucleic acid-binding Zn-ribbon protein
VTNRELRLRYRIDRLTIERDEARDALELAREDLRALRSDFIKANRLLQHAENEIVSLGKKLARKQRRQVAA